MGKKVIATTTAAFECQSKPNHITMIGAMPMIGSAEAKSAIGRMPRRRNGLRSQISATANPASAADGPARQRRLQDGLDEIREQDRARGRELGEDRRGRRHQHERNAAADADDLPQREHDEPEQQRRQDVAQAALRARFGIDPASRWFSHQAAAQAASAAIQNTAGTAPGRACAQPIRAAKATASAAAATAGAALMAALPWPARSGARPAPPPATRQAARIAAANSAAQIWTVWP